MTQHLKDAIDPIAWLIEHDAANGYWLIGTKNERVVTTDGPHSSKAGVMKAKELHERLHFSNKADRYVMVQFGEVPEPKRPIRLNEDAIETCNHALDQFGDTQNLERMK